MRKPGPCTPCSCTAEHIRPYKSWRKYATREVACQRSLVDPWLQSTRRLIFGRVLPASTVRTGYQSEVEDRVDRTAIWPYK